MRRGLLHVFGSHLVRYGAPLDFAKRNALQLMKSDHIQQVLLSLQLWRAYIIEHFR
jgi:hypothetical protein